MRSAYAFTLALAACCIPVHGTLEAQQWKPAGTKIMTEWASKVDPSDALPEYPRPMLVRNAWENLNGLWNYAIRPKGGALPSAFDGTILVPYPVESALSGVGRAVGIEQELWYERTFLVPHTWKGKRILLNFGAVDWRADVWINQIKAGSHQGGYTPFSLDITPLLSNDSLQRITVRVWDPADKGYQPRGKQVSAPSGIWYTSVTGIWQTVWLEPVGEAHIAGLRMLPDVDMQTLTVSAQIGDARASDMIDVRVLTKGRLVGSARALSGEAALVPVPQAHLWSPDDPFLYELEVTLLRDGAPIDRVSSYAGMRKVSTRRDSNGIVRLQLNNRDMFQFGPLDQGWWPDGLYTAPSDAALAFDIEKTKELGFNLIRKHVKVEPERWYYHCDRLGILVWQDMPSGDRTPRWEQRGYFRGPELERSLASEQAYRDEWKAIIDRLYSHPCVVAWVPFNEAWGQFKTVEIADWTKTYDPSRLVNPASGGNFFETGDMLDIHNYPAPVMAMYDGRRANVLGEYGGIGLIVKGHTWADEKNWGYVKYQTSREATDVYVQFTETLRRLIDAGLSAAVYTQTTDVEMETNGLMTYDRKVVKLDPKRLANANGAVTHSLGR